MCWMPLVVFVEIFSFLLVLVESQNKFNYLEKKYHQAKIWQNTSGVGITDAGSIVDDVAGTGGTGAVSPDLAVAVTKPDMICREVTTSVKIILASG